jgi:hypothetical protein
MTNNPQPYDLGYTFYPPRYPQALGHPRLDVVIRKVLTCLHFDPERGSPVIDQDGTIEMLTVFHPWMGAKPASQHWPDSILIARGKRPGLFGWEIDIRSSDEQTVCVIE